MTSKIITEKEYWFLDLVVRWWWPLKGLELEPAELEFHANKSAHHLGHVELVNILSDLLLKGDLVFSRAHSHSENEQHAPFIPSKSEIEEALAGRDEIYYGLTNQGGRRWEMASVPNWDLFLYEASRGRKENDVRVMDYEVISSNRVLVEQWLNTEEIPVNSPSWEQLTPWQVTYWKTLPMGHQVKFQQIYAEDYGLIPLSRRAERALESRQNAREKLILKTDSWYKNPWQA